MKILITGASGLLGFDLWMVLSGGHELYGLGRTENPDYIRRTNWLGVDLTDPTETCQVITKVNPELVIHAAALTDVDACELNPEKAYLVNTLATRNVALACQRFDAAMFYVSTDYVFAGDRDTPYREDVVPNPINTYGKTKYGGEFYVRHLLNKFYIVRTSWLFGKRKKNFVSALIEKMRNEKIGGGDTEIKVVADQVSRPTYTKDLALSMNELIKRPLYGVYHLTNEGVCSRYEMAQNIVQFLGKKNKVVPISQRELNRPAMRPKYSALENYNWQIQGFRPLRNWKEALQDYLLEL